MLMRNKSKKPDTRGKSRTVPRKKAGNGEPKKLMKVDKDWFESRMKAVGCRNFAQLGRELGIERALVTRSLSGERVFTPKDVVALAKLFRTTTDEVFLRIGYNIPKRGVPIIGVVRDDGRVSTVTAKKGDVFELAQPPDGAQAIVGEMTSAVMAGYDGATFISVPAPKGVQAAAGQLCLVEIEGHITPYIGKIVKGSTRVKPALEVLGSGQRIELDRVNAINPIALIYFA